MTSCRAVQGSGLACSFLCADQYLFKIAALLGMLADSYRSLWVRCVSMAHEPTRVHQKQENISIYALDLLQLGSLLSAVATVLRWDSLCLQQDLYRLICHSNCP